jgi:hypothetical protein
MAVVEAAAIRLQEVLEAVVVDNYQSAAAQQQQVPALMVEPRDGASWLSVERQSLLPQD